MWEAGFSSPPHPTHAPPQLKVLDLSSTLDETLTLLYQTN